VVASAALLGIFFIPSVFGEVVNQIFQTRWFSLISLGALIANITAGLFGTFTGPTVTRRFEDANGAIVQVSLYEPPLWAAWAMLFVICATCLALLSRKVKAYEVVR
jgi:hypothetical protein